MNPLFQIIPMWTPFLPTNCSKPPTIYSLLQSIVNYDAENKTSTSNLASAGRTTIFDFDYPLSTHESKEKFECMILNHFMMRRIGYETLTSFKIALNVKLNEIMQNYNLLFDALYNWDLFDNGETITRSVTDSRSKTGTKSGNGTRQSTSTDDTTLSGTTSDSNTSDRRFSNMPNNQIANVQNGSYLSDYNYDTNTGSGTSSSTGHNANAFSETNTNAENTSLTDAGSLTETISKTNDDSKQLDNLLKFTKDRQNIYTMIFKDLDVLFYQLD